MKIPNSVIKSLAMVGSEELDRLYFILDTIGEKYPAIQKAVEREIEKIEVNLINLEG